LHFSKADGAAVKVGLDDGEKFRFDRDAAFFSAFAFNVDDSGASISGAEVADVGPAEFAGSEPCQ
jgi:hypothetical protein